MAYIEVKHESKRYKMGETIITANNDINFTADQGKLTVILGPSGAGKSTLLNILGGMDSPTEGEVWIDGTDIATFSDRQLTAFRRHNVGFVFQFYNLIPNLTTRENVELAGSIVKDALDPTTVLKQVGLGARLDNFPSQLSGGEQQRVAIARALVSEAPVILADEPTGNLDEQTAGDIIAILKKLAKERQKCVIVVTHSKEVAEASDVVLELSRRSLVEKSK